MKISIRIAIAIFIIGVVLIGLRIYIGFNGNPITKHKVSLQEKAYAEKKYGEKVKIVKSYLNFKEGTYSTTLQEVNQPKLTYEVYQTIEVGPKTVTHDSLPESVWGNEIKEKTLPTIKKLFHDANETDIYVEIGVEYTLPHSSGSFVKIPPYTSMKNVPYKIIITLKNTKLTEKEYPRILELVQFLKKEKLTRGDLLFRYNKDLSETVGIFNEDLSKIDSIADIKRLHEY